MKSPIALVILLALVSFSMALSARAGEPVQFRGVCQQCGHDLLAVYRPEPCRNGRVEWQWVKLKHQHCRPAYLGREKREFFDSHLMNPANPKRAWRERCAPRLVRYR